MTWQYLEKELYDYAGDIEAVNIHYACTPLGQAPDWETQCVTRYMPVAHPVAAATDQAKSEPFALRQPTASPARLRKKVLKLPAHLCGPEKGESATNYLLHYYFEIFQAGHRHYSPLYTEDILTQAEVDEAHRQAVPCAVP